MVSTDLPREHPHRRYAGRLVIPSFSARDTITDIAFRCIQPHSCKETVLWVDDKGRDRTCMKYLFPSGSTKRLFNVGDVGSASSTIHILEGQLNAATLVACGEAAVGCTGADGWKAHYWRLFQGFDRVIVWRDGDDKEPKPLPDGTPRKKGGDLFVSKVRERIQHAEVAECPPGYDPNSYYVQWGRDALLALADSGLTEDADAVSVSGDSYDGSQEQELEEGEQIVDDLHPPF